MLQKLKVADFVHKHIALEAAKESYNIGFLFPHELVNTWHCFTISEDSQPLETRANYFHSSFSHLS